MRVIRNKYDIIIKRELAGLLAFSLFASLAIFALGVMAFLFMVEQGWIN